MMGKKAALAPLAVVALDATSPVPRYRQIYGALRGAILSRQLAPGTRLPATRLLAAELGVARNTVMLAFDLLLAEGYLEGKVGAGTFVARTLPDDLLRPALAAHPPAVGPGVAMRSGQEQLAARGKLLATTPSTAAQAGEGTVVRAFRAGVPALDAFPIDLWSRLVAHAYRHAPPEALFYGDAAGYAPLRAALATYLGAARAVQCTPEQVLIVAGAQQGIDLAARLLIDPGATIWMEDPAYVGARGALLAAGARIIPVPLDDEGLDLATAQQLADDARMVYVSPSHQYPLGMTMSLARRLALLEWARATDAWIIEDDYDSEYRYAGRPLAALQGLDQGRRVIYLGTFSKVMFPALRLGYIVVPPELVAPFTAARALVDRHSPVIEQIALTEFITAGHFSHHIRRMRALYAERQQLLVAAAQPLAGRLDVRPSSAGMHLIGWLPPGSDDLAVARRAARFGVDAVALSSYALRPLPRGGLVLGYAHTDASAIQAGIQGLTQALG